jgi:hypothetical protein
VETHCQRHHQTIICNLDVPKNINLVELPILYYPDMIHMTLNGKTITPQGILYRNIMLAGIVPEANIKNNIEIQFRGIHWANIVSQIAWIISLLLLLKICVQLKIKSGNKYG